MNEKESEPQQRDGEQHMRSQGQVDNRKGKKHQQHSENDRWGRIKNLWPRKETSVTEWLLVSITFVYMVVSFFQWQATRTGLSLTRESNELAQRAWVLTTGVGPIQETSGDAGVVITAKNFGKSPAQDVVIGTGWLIAKEPPSSIRPPDTVVSRSLMGPDAAYPSTATLAGLTKEKIAFARTLKEESLYVFGVITYKDPFSANRSTFFCWRYNMSQTPPSFDFCATGNRAQ